MRTYCGAKCEECQFKSNCKGCMNTCGKPFGGICVAAEYVKVGGRESYGELKKQLIGEINSILRTLRIPEIEALYELPGAYVNLGYLLPNGETVKFLDDSRIYLGAQIEIEGTERCVGVVADTTFLLIGSYVENGTDPELILFRHR